MRPVLEDPALGEQARDGVARVVAGSACERDPVAPLHGRDRVELDARERANRRLDARSVGAAIPARVALRGDGKPSNRVALTVVSSIVSQSTFLEFARRAPAAAAGAGARRRLRAGRADDGAGRRGVRRARDRPARAAGRALPAAEARGRRGDRAVRRRSSPASPSTTSAISTRGSTRSPGSFRPGGVLVVDEFAWDRLDETTLDWLYGQRRALAAAGHGEAPASQDELRREWEAEHLGLHGFAALREGLDARFDEREFAWMPLPAPNARGRCDRGARAGADRRRRHSGARIPLRGRRSARLTRRSTSPESGMPRGPITRLVPWLNSAR